MAKKGKDSRPTRGHQKARSVKNKIKQLEDHLESHPKDKNSKDKLEHVKKTGNSRARTGVNVANTLARVRDTKRGGRG